MNNSKIIKLGLLFFTAFWFAFIVAMHATRSQQSRTVATGLCLSMDAFKHQATLLVRVAMQDTAISSANFKLRGTRTYRDIGTGPHKVLDKSGNI